MRKYYLVLGVCVILLSAYLLLQHSAYINAEQNLIAALKGDACISISKIYIKGQGINIVLSDDESVRCFSHAIANAKNVTSYGTSYHLTIVNSNYIELECSARVADDGSTLCLIFPADEYRPDHAYTLLFDETTPKSLKSMINQLGSK